MSLKIQQKFHVDDQCFDTMEEAELYLLNHADQQRIDAFINHLRENGAQRISKSLPDTLMDFIKFEKGETTQTPSEESEQEPVQSNAEVQEEIQVDAPPFDPDPVEESEQEEVETKKSTSSIFDDPQYAQKEQEAEEEIPSEPDVFAQTEQPTDRVKLFG